MIAERGTVHNPAKPAAAGYPAVASTTAPKPEPAEELDPLKWLDELFIENPMYCNRWMQAILKRKGDSAVDLLRAPESFSLPC